MHHTDAAAAEHAKAFDLHCQGRLSDAEALYRNALDINPDLIAGWMNLGLVALGQHRPEEAMAFQRRALALDPENADALNNLGLIHYTNGHIAEAEACFYAALLRAPDHPNATLNLGSARQLANQPEEAELLFRRAMDLGVDPVRVKNNLALAMMEQARPADAEALCREALSITDEQGDSDQGALSSSGVKVPASAAARVNRSLALLTLGRLEEGWRDYESRWAVEAMAAPLPQLAQPRWTGQPLNGETVVLYAEQGFGDVLQFCRYAPLVTAAGGRVVLVVPKALRRIMQSLPGVADLFCEEDGLLPPFDYHCPLMSLPFAFGTTLETVPAAPAYLFADSAPWRDFLAGLSGLKVGLVWAGKSRTEQPHAVAIDKRRSMRLADMAPLLSVPNCTFVSLQLGPPAGQMLGVEGLIDVSDRLGDWADTAALVSGLDLVIAVDTAVAHLAGALGRPVWMLNRHDTCWRWMLEREDTPWYPSMRIFRQTRRGDWESVIARVRDALTALAQPTG